MTPALGSRLGDEITVGGIKYSDSLQADELLFKQASLSTRRGRPHQPGTLGSSACEMQWGAPGWDTFLFLGASCIRCLSGLWRVVGNTQVKVLSSQN